ncbi:hypothetical protein VMCG_06039 [Cytospora schulzeri]|uniref:Uncharacterized protein n=1 Tax=Cytospora schulzeri TaxID=448051 RepID=A0A423WGD2_9PEZI|nr:hypothetical protein VMCG_06039 [Valsa malicola]
MSSTLNGLATSLNRSSNNHHATGTVQGTGTSGSEALLSGVGAQFDAHSSGLSGGRHDHKVKRLGHGRNRRGTLAWVLD